ncbi:aldehyde dehydrogenase [Mycolicibacterium sp.]|uniref:aldehyde dehydrogenase n=1 Tax=Mycolicibacterium sp. TaxID=2320850 RepID=UPI003D0E3065
MTAPVTQWLTDLDHQPRDTVGTNFVGGVPTGAQAGRSFQSTDPTTGEHWSAFALSDPGDVDAAVASARSAYRQNWAGMSARDRGRLLSAWATAIEADAERIARLEAIQNGKVLAELRAQVVAAGDWLHYYGGLADKIEGAVIPLPDRDVLNYTLREPLGVIGVILPWNSPSFHLAMAVAPALAAGNTVVIKPSEVTSASALVLAELAVTAGIPPGVVNVVTGLREAGEALVAHPDIAKISFIGSVAAGRVVGAQAGRRLVGATLELGGKSPNIVFADADLDMAEAGILAGIFAAAGQTCIAGSRAYIHESVVDELLDRLIKRAEQIVVGDPLQPGTQMGPVASADQLAKDESAVAAAVACGAALATGGHRISVPGYPGGFFFQPTIFTDVTPENPLLRTEVFGPVLAVCPFGTDAEVVRMANDSEFGLAAGVWTTDVRRAHAMARALQAGTVWINTYRALACNSPFGGYKDSGIGRNNGIEAVHQYLQTKSVWCNLGTDPIDPFVIRL